MKFAIATTEYFQELGFETGSWRKSVDGSLAMCHAEFALTLSDENMLEIYNHDDPDFIALLGSAEWSGNNDEETPEEK